MADIKDLDLWQLMACVKEGYLQYKLAAQNHLLDLQQKQQQDTEHQGVSPVEILEHFLYIQGVVDKTLPYVTHLVEVEKNLQQQQQQQDNEQENNNSKEGK